jgi:hypothetical protein
MNIRKNMTRTALILFALTQTAQAYELLCSNKSVKSNDQFTTTAQFSSSELTIEELMDLFATGSQAKRQTPTLVCMLPNSHLATQKLFSDMGVEPATFKAVVNRANDQTKSLGQVKIVNTESEMLACVTSTHPSVGYVDRLSKVHQQFACFE